MTTTKHNLKLNVDVGHAQGYRGRGDMVRAARRALRWVHQVRNQGLTPPRHIAAKMLLIKVTSDA